MFFFLLKYLKYILFSGNKYIAPENILPSMSGDYYSILGVTSNASINDIKKAYVLIFTFLQHFVNQRSI